MKLVIFISILFSILSMGCQQSSSVAGTESKNLKSEGHEQGNGVDNLPYDYSDAWFSGDVTVNYCVEIANDFGLPEKTVLDNVQSAFKKWKDYIGSNKINEQMLRNALSSLEPNEQDKAKDLVAFTKTNLLQSCDGHEDVKFYFGTEDKAVSEAKKAHVDPTAFAQNIFRDVYTGKGKGFVWIAKQASLTKDWMKEAYPDWSLPNALLGILTHEIGHIYGIGHIEGTIMDPVLGIFLRKNTLGFLPEDFRQRALKEIDFKKQLFTPSIMSDLRSYEGQMTITAMYFCRPLSCPLNSYDPVKVDQEITENFQYIVGRVPVGTVTSSYFQGKLKLVDAISVSEFNLAIDFDQLPSVGSRQSIFKFSRAWPFEKRHGYLAASGGSVEHEEVSYLGSLTKQDGTEVTIMIEQNNYGPFSIFYINKGKKKALLIMDALKL